MPASINLTLWASDEYVAQHAAGAFRPLRLEAEWLRGGDVYALQTCLHVWNPDIICDGWFGPQSDAVVEEVQSRLGLVVDGIAGNVTQSTLTTKIAKRVGARFELPPGVPLGHVQQECSGIPGNYGPIYTSGQAKGTRDRGAVMMNTGPWPSDALAFDAPAAIAELCMKVKGKFVAYSRSVDTRRAWQLACGSWNAPAWTDALARGGTLSSTQLAWIEGYIDRVTAFAPSIR